MFKFILLIALSVFASGEDFAKKIEKAFDQAEKLPVDLLKSGTEVWGGECVSHEKNQKTGKTSTTFLGDGYLVIESLKKMGKRTLKYGYGGSDSPEEAVASYETGYKSYSNAYLNSGKDLTQDIVSESFSGEGSDDSYQSKGQTFLRRGVAFGEKSYLFLSRSKTYKDFEMEPISLSDLYCYFSEQVK